MKQICQGYRYEDILKLHEKLQPREVNYRDYKYFENNKFRTDLLSEFGKANIKDRENGLNNLLNGYKRILEIHIQSYVFYAQDSVCGNKS